MSDYHNDDEDDGDYDDEGSLMIATSPIGLGLVPMSIFGMKGCLPKLRASGVVLGRLHHPTVPRPTKASPLNSAFHLAFTSYSVAAKICYSNDHFSHLCHLSILSPFFMEPFTSPPQPI
jgi:hypothetical protein